MDEIERLEREGASLNRIAILVRAQFQTRELEDRRATILASIQEQNKLTPELRAAIEAADTASTS